MTGQKPKLCPFRQVMVTVYTDLGGMDYDERVEYAGVPCVRDGCQVWNEYLECCGMIQQP